MTLLPDSAIVSLAKRGNQDAFATLYKRYVDAIHRFCWYQLHDEDQALDCTQQTFVEVIKSLKSFSGSGSVKNWIYAIAKRQVLQVIREKYQLPSEPLGEWIIDEQNPDWVDPDAQVQQTHHEHVVEKLLQQVSNDEATLLRLVYLQGYTSREAGAVTGKTPESVRVILHRAIKKLQ